MTVVLRHPRRGAYRHTRRSSDGAAFPRCDRTKHRFRRSRAHQAEFDSSFPRWLSSGSIVPKFGPQLVKAFRLGATL